MVFSSLHFLYVFLPLCLLGYYVLPSLRCKNLFLMAASLLFYAWGEPRWIILLVFSALVDYVNGRIIEAHRGTGKAKAALIASVVINLSLLSVFKYAGFLVGTVNSLTGAGLPVPSFSLPIGISFYTFQTLSYTIDAYRGRVPVQKSFTNFLLFVSLFPQLIAGPILRYADVAAQLEHRRTTPSGVALGLTRFCTGLAKKVLLANVAGELVKTLIGGDLAAASVLGTWLGIFLFALQIYFDFSGYSDMAIGLGYLFGFRYVENFNFPYVSRSITDFWRRWHMTLSGFFRDYLYIPLGGNRRHPVRNLLIVWGLTGLWHGASWSFVLWGLYYFVFLALEKYVYGKGLQWLPAVFQHVYALLVVLVGWVFFYCEDLGRLGQMFGVLFGLSGQPALTPTVATLFANHLIFILLAVAACLPISRVSKRLLRGFAGHGRAQAATAGLITVAYAAVMLLLSTAALVGSSYNPFLYFRF